MSEHKQIQNNESRDYVVSEHKEHKQIQNNYDYVVSEHKQIQNKIKIQNSSYVVSVKGRKYIKKNPPSQ